MASWPPGGPGAGFWTSSSEAIGYAYSILNLGGLLAGRSGLLCFAVPGAASSGGGVGVSCCWPAARACLDVQGAAGSGLVSIQFGG